MELSYSSSKQLVGFELSSSTLISSTMKSQKGRRCTDAQMRADSLRLVWPKSACCVLRVAELLQIRLRSVLSAARLSRHKLDPEFE